MPYYYELQVEFTDNEGNFVDDPDIIVSWDQGKKDDWRSGLRTDELTGSAFREKLFETFDGYNSEAGFINQKGHRCQLVVVQNYCDTEGFNEDRDWYYVDRLNYNKDTKTINCNLPKYVTNFINNLLANKEQN